MKRQKFNNKFEQLGNWTFVEHRFNFYEYNKNIAMRLERQMASALDMTILCYTLYNYIWVFDIPGL